MMTYYRVPANGLSLQVSLSKDLRPCRGGAWAGLHTQEAAHHWHRVDYRVGLDIVLVMKLASGQHLDSW
jgi:hypothetical protein